MKLYVGKDERGRLTFGNKKTCWARMNGAWWFYGTSAAYVFDDRLKPDIPPMKTGEIRKVKSITIELED